MFKILLIRKNQVLHKFAMKDILNEELMTFH